MKNLHLTKDKDGKSGIFNIPVEDVFYFENCIGKIRRLNVHTSQGMFYAMGTMTYLMEALNNSGYHFSVGDRSACINLDRVVRVNEYFLTAYFDDSNEGCMLTDKGYQELMEELKVLNPNMLFN
ncbi:LytTR family transcriptional regulator DNA-binding domain-containing protein [Paenibacillus sp. sgz500958]|uniref:LytTR family transcriptional regulator DNA-binding domain-containing protein n=1 Tax=Paenibacillus sp. sgz500958 TaxID=3242475 RepID=UPI0036D28401